MDEDRPTREEVEGWVGARLDEISGASMGTIEGAFVSEESGRPEWILIRVGRFGHHTVVPARQAVAGVGHIWVSNGCRGEFDVTVGGPGDGTGLPGLPGTAERVTCESQGGERLLA